MKYYIYEHKYASGSKKGKVFYVGKGSGKRLNSTYRRNKYWKSIVKKYGFTAHKVFQCSTEDMAFLLERNRITFYKLNGEKLCNMTEGGEGSSGRPCSERTKEAVRKANTGRKHTLFAKEKMSLARKGVKKSEEHKRKIAKGHIGKRLSTEHKNSISKNRLGKYTGIDNPNFKGYWVCGKHGKYASLGLASKELEIPICTIRNRCVVDKSNIFPEWYFIEK